MKVSIVIDGRETSVERGTVLLRAARKIGIEIPALCHHEALAPYGACRLCLVEIQRQGRTRLTTSCNYPVLREGETVSTCSPKVEKTRKLIVELLLARCPDSKLVRATAESLGVRESRFPPPAPSRMAAGEPALTDCILCGLCVRACEGAIGASAISFVDRGPNRRVASPFRQSSSACTGCGACASVCPTGVIRLEDTAEGIRRLTFFDTEVSLLRCKACGAFHAPLPQAEALRAKIPAAGEYLTLCPKCRMRKLGVEISRAGGMRGDGFGAGPAPSGTASASARARPSTRDDAASAGPREGERE